MPTYIHNETSPKFLNHPHHQKFFNPPPPPKNFQLPPPRKKNFSIPHSPPPPRKFLNPQNMLTGNSPPPQIPFIFLSTSFPSLFRKRSENFGDTYFFTYFRILQFVPSIFLIGQATTRCTPSHFMYSCIQTIIIIRNTW